MHNTALPIVNPALGFHAEPGPGFTMKRSCNIFSFLERADKWYLGSRILALQDMHYIFG